MSLKTRIIANWTKGLTLRSSVLLLIFVVLVIFTTIITAIISFESQKALESLLDAKLRQTAHLVYTQTDAWLGYQKKILPSLKEVKLDDDDDDDDEEEEEDGDGDHDSNDQGNFPKSHHHEKDHHQITTDSKNNLKRENYHSDKYQILAIKPQELSWLDKNVMTNNLDYSQPVILQIFNNFADMGLGDQNILISKRPKKLQDHPISNLRWGHGETNLEGKLWRTFSYSKEDNPLLVIIAEPHPDGANIARKFLANLMLPFAILTPLTIFFVFFVVNRAFLPLNNISQVIKRLNPLKDTGPLPQIKIPREVEPMIQAINLLLKKVAEGLKTERQFTDDAAHELRTPLAAIKAQTQVAQRTRDEKGKFESLGHIQHTVENMSSTLDHLLILARLEQENLDFEMENQDIHPLIQEIMAEFGQVALKKDISLIFNEAHESIYINTHLFRIMFLNLIENAIKFTPPKGTIEVLLRKESQTIILEIHDSGPGLSLDEQKEVFKRFFRGKGSHKTTGSGLGLAIVQKIAEIQNCHVQLGTSAHHQGLLVRLIFNRD